jgi:hypothetical protein
VSERSTSVLAMTAVALASAALFWLLREHWGHALGLAPYLLFLACAILHFFMHRGHGHGHWRGRQ